MPLDSSPIKILLVEDNPGDVRLTAETLRTGEVANDLHVAKDGGGGDGLPRRESPHGAPRPDLVILDLNLPRKDGIEVLPRSSRTIRYRHPIVILRLPLPSGTFLVL